jgi:hypothetical protein
MPQRSAPWRAAVGIACLVAMIWLSLAVGFALYEGTSVGRAVKRIPVCGHENGAPGDPPCYREGELRPLLTTAPAEAIVALIAGWFLAGAAAWWYRRLWLTFALPPAWFLLWSALFLTG